MIESGHGHTGNPGLDAVSSLGDPVRRALYEFVAGRTEPVGRDEAAAAVGIGRPLAAYHLDKLVTFGLLTASYQRQPGRSGPGAGRPAKVYARSGSEFAVTVPHREYELAARLLAAAVESDRSGESRAALRDAARQFGGDLGRRCRAADPGRRTRSRPRRTRCASTASSHGPTKTAPSGCATAPSTTWPPSTPRSSAA